MKQKSFVFSDLSGSAANVTASRNRGGQYLRNRTAPTNPQTDRQTVVRAVMSAKSAAWRSLTEVQRTAWNAAAANFQSTDSLGQPVAKTGHQVFVQLNAALLNADPAASQISTPPTPVAFPTIDISAVVIKNDAGDLNISGSADPVNVPTNFKCVVYATPLLSAGISAPPNSGYKQLGVIDAGDPFTDFGPMWNAHFGASATGKKVFVSFSLVSTNTGQVKEVANTGQVLVAA